MNETLEMFQLQQGALTVALRANPEPQGVLRIVKGQMEVQGDSTNLSGACKSGDSLVRSQARGPSQSRDDNPPAQNFTNQKEGDAQCAALVSQTRYGDGTRVTVPPIIPGLTQRSNAAPSVQSALVAADEKRHRSENGSKSSNGSGYPKSFDGSTYVPALDKARLSGQLKRVRDLMSDGRSRTLAQIAQEVGSSEASVSARLRDLRKPRFGLFTVRRKRIGKGLYCYQLGERGI